MALVMHHAQTATFSVGALTAFAMELHTKVGDDQDLKRISLNALKAAKSLKRTSYLGLQDSVRRGVSTDEIQKAFDLPPMDAGDIGDFTNLQTEFAVPVWLSV